MPGQPLPARLTREDFAPMPATLGELPPAEQDHAWGYEFTWDGVRAVAAVRAGRLVLRSRTGADITVRYPELAALPAALAGHDVVVDGEIVALDGQGRPDFAALQNRMHRTGPEVPRLAADRPVAYLAFDLLAVDGEDLVDLPYAQRRQRLDALAPPGRRWMITPWFAGGGATVSAARLDNALEGVVAKRLDSPYRPGFTPRRTPPFDGVLPREVTRDPLWVEPTLVGEVAYGVWTADGRLRHPSWRGLRDDLEPEDVVVEW